MKYRTIVGYSASVTLLLVTAAAVGTILAQNAPPPGTWTDSKTGLMWTLKDNGADVKQPDALDYCQNLNLADFKDWRLPAIDQLASIYDESVTQRPPGKDYDVHVKGGVQVTSCCVWSATSGGKGPVAFYFGRGLQHSEDANLLRRALCVRRAGQ